MPRPTLSFSLLFVLFFCLLSSAFPQTTPVQVGQGAPTGNIQAEFQTAYLRDEFFNTVVLPPVSEVVAFGTGGYRQEFQDANKNKSALVRPANPNLSFGLAQAVRQVRNVIYTTYIQSGIGVGVAGFPDRDTTEFQYSLPGTVNAEDSGFYQTFDRNFAIFVWTAAPVDGGTETRFTIADPIYTRWKSIGLQQIGPPILNLTPLTSRTGLRANYQRFGNGAIYVLTSGASLGRVIYVRKAVDDLLYANQGPSGTLGLPLSDETVLADGRRRQSFEGGTVEYALNGVPTLKPSLLAVVVPNENALRLNAGESATLDVILQTANGDRVTDREVFWTTSNGRVATVSSSGLRATVRAVGGGTAQITATSEGRSSRPISVFVSSQCCQIGEGAPNQSISQTFLDSIQRNRLSLRLPTPSAVRRLGAGFLQEAFLLGNNARILILKADSSPLAYVLSGALLTAYETLGGPASQLGYPQSDANTGGTQFFEGGALAGSPIQIVSEPLLTRWRNLALETGILGPPLAASRTFLSFSGAAGNFQAFRNGALYHFTSGSQAGKVYFTSGRIAARHAELGGVSGPIGAPLTDEFLSGNATRQEFEGATLEFLPGSPVTSTEKARRPTLSVSPSTVLPGGRIRISIGGFPAGSRLNVTQPNPNTANGTPADIFEVNSSTGAYVWDTIVPSTARAGLVALRATDRANAQVFAEGSYTVRSLAETRPVLSRLSGDSQSGSPSTVLPLPLRIVLRDASGNPLPNVPVRFEATPGAAVISPSTVTSADGLAEARLRLPAQNSVALVTAEAAGLIVTFSARSASTSLSDFPRLSQNVAGNLGNSTSPLAQKGSLLAAMASVIRFYQQRGLVPAPAGLADTTSLNTYLRTFCLPDTTGNNLCDGFLEFPGADPQPNPWRVLNFASNLLDIAVEDPTLAALREVANADTPVIIGLELLRNGQPAGVHFVSAFGVAADGDLLISDPNPAWGRITLSQYLTGFAVTESGVSNNLRATLGAAFRFVPRPANPSVFLLSSSTRFTVASPGAPCSRVLSWPAFFAGDAAPAASPTNVYLQACSSATATANYQVSLPGTPFQMSLTDLASPASISLVSGNGPAAFKAIRQTDVWVLQPQDLSLLPSAVLNAADFSSRIGAGSIVSIFGAGLQSVDGSVASPTQIELSGQPLPVLFTGPFQVNAAFPADLVPGFYTLRLRNGFGESTANLEISDLAPAIFTVGANRGAILNQNNALNTPEQPATRGQAIVIYCTGLGAVAPLASGLSATRQAVSVSLNGRDLNPFFAGLAPGFIGLYQVNVVVPQSAPPGIDQPLSLRLGSVESNGVLVSLR
jgi:uncharacterized protein (TIGR03437 family)